MSEGFKVGSATKGPLQPSDESGEDDESLGLVSKSDRKTKARKYDSKKLKSETRFCCCCSSRLTCLCVCIGAIVVLTLIVTALVAVVAVLLVDSSKQDSGHGTSGGSKNDSRTISEESDTETVPWGSMRLPSSVVPETYDIKLTIDMDSFQVSGLVSISCSVRSSIEYIALHAVGMNISGHTLRSTSGEMVEHNEVLYPENDFFIFNLTKPLEPGPIVAVLHFNYPFGDNLAGFYRSSYKDADGKEQYLAVTQFEPTDARKAFPCFDEPSFKANFSISITHQSRYRAWSNMPTLSMTKQPGTGEEFVTTHFQTSMRMSTYLVAFIVSDFQCINDTMVSTSGKEVVVSIYIVYYS